MPELLFGSEEAAREWQQRIRTATRGPCEVIPAVRSDGTVTGWRVLYDPPTPRELRLIRGEPETCVSVSGRRARKR